MVEATLLSLAPRNVHPPHAPRDPGKVAALAAAMRAGGWRGRPLLAWRCGRDGEVLGLTGSHRVAAARAAGLDGVPVLVVEAEAEGPVAALEALRDLADLPGVLAEHDVDPEAVALAEAEGGP